jgi:ABC-2 type transport system ATP-binding protein
MVSLRNTSKTYGSVPACTDISFDVNPGEITALLGANGAGKSTILKIVSGVTSPDCGDVSLCEIDLSADSVKARSLCGCVFENTPLYPDLTVKETLDFAAGMHGMDKTARSAAVARAIELCNMCDVAGRLVGNLSRGYRQRAALAQALVHDPRVLVLDEPTSGLDPVQLSEFRKLMRSVSVGKTILFSTHIMQEVESLCDRVIMLDRGRLIADGSIHDLCARTGAKDIEAAFLALVSKREGRDQ